MTDFQQKKLNLSNSKLQPESESGLNQVKI